MVYTFSITGKDRETILHSKTMTQVLLLLLGGAMVLFGVWRGEAGVVLSKAIRLCMECVGIG